MPYNEKLAERVKQSLVVPLPIEEKKMFGGLCFMVNEKMCVGVEKERLMVRLDPNIYNEALTKEGCNPMNFTGKIMKGFVYVDLPALNTKKKLDYWINLALEFNKLAKSSKKKKTKP